MKKLAATSVLTIALAISANTAQAAVMDYEQALRDVVVSGKVESWVGITAVTSVEGGAGVDDGFYGAAGGGVALSMPLGNGLAMQMDANWERSMDTLGGTVGNDRFSDSFQGAVHLSKRDPGMGLLGVFGGAGQANFQDDGENSSNEATFAFVGGEAQFYLQDWTLYGQAGAIIASGDDDILGNDDVNDAAFFVRGVARWFVDDMSRLQVEGAFANGDVDDGEDVDGFNMDVFEWGVRYDRVVALPVIGETQLFAGYRGTSFDKNGNSGGESDDGSFVEHTFMIGTSISFGGNTMQEFDRVGATLDTPNIGRWVISGEQVE